MVTADEIEELIVKLHKEGKTIREIAKIVQKNFTFISAVLKKRFPEEYPEAVSMTRETQALRLYSQQKKPVQVAIELGLNTDETEKFYKNFWRLERLYELYRIYDEHRPNLKAFLRFFNQLKKRKITSHKDFEDILKIVDTNIALDAEIEDFDADFLPEKLKGKPHNPTRRRTEFPANHVYTADELG